MITALILAAGVSRRMGQPKLALPWGDITVLGQVIHTIRDAGVDDFLVVIGGGGEAVESVCRTERVRAVIPGALAADSMLGSLQAGLLEVPPSAGAALIALGDQPQIEKATTRMIAQCYYSSSGASIIVPSYGMRRGHPWLVSRAFWQELLELKPPETAREFLARHALDIRYVEVNTPSILQDLDSPEDYLKSKP
jgi:molybdenum cofactor cytidylyltransferase